MNPTTATTVIETATPVEELARLERRNAEARQRVEQLERDQRAAGQARQEARAALVEAERRGAAPADRKKLEQTLADAEARASEPWPERIEGARAAARDLTGERRQLVAHNLLSLAEAVEADGGSAASAINEHCAGLIAAYHRRQELEQRLFTLASTVRVTEPGDVSRSKADQLAKAAMALLQAGGETPPVLRRDRYGLQAQTAEPVAGDGGVEWVTA
jgi:hypothetical protein